jgi:hypothetical protein
MLHAPVMHECAVHHSLLAALAQVILLKGWHSTIGEGICRAGLHPIGSSSSSIDSIQN